MVVILKVQRLDTQLGGLNKILMLTLQSESTKTVTEVLNLFRASDITQVVKSLSTEQQDVLMKYLYAGMGKPEQYNSSVLLTWHEKVRT